MKAIARQLGLVGQGKAQGNKCFTNTSILKIIKILFMNSHYGNRSGHDKFWCMISK